MNKNFEKLQFLFYSSSFIMKPELKLRNFFGSGSSQKGWLRAAPAPKLWFHQLIISFLI